MKPVKTSLISIASAILGGVLVFLAIKYIPQVQRAAVRDRDAVYDNILERQRGIDQNFDDLFNDDFFSQNDPFEEMRKMREQMQKRMQTFGAQNDFRGNPFDSWFSGKFGGGTVDDIKKREDDDFVYYDIKVDDVTETSIDTKIENGYITITGTTEKTAGDGDDAATSMFKSSFNRTFPLPENVDENNMQMIPEKDKIVLKFPKLKT